MIQRKSLYKMKIKTGVFISLCLLASSHGQENFLQSGLTNFLQEILHPQTPKNNDVFDFIVVGGGTAGGVVANRLSENPKWRVALIEAGGTENFFHSIPALCGYIQIINSVWKYKTVPQKRACFGMYNNECFHPRGKLLGGTSSINFMIYNRGNRRDFDSWAEAGNYGWSYQEVLPYFLKSEMASLDGLEFTPYHNQSGSLSVEYIKYRTQIAHAFIEGAQQVGHTYTDYNGESQLGVSYVQANTRGGRRHSSYRAFLEPVMSKRQNLKIFTFSQVTKVLIDPATKAAYGVEFIYGKKRYVFKARKEVILSAGSFNSPQILMLSGIGPKDNLSRLGINIVQELPVGVKMYEHASHFGPTFLVNTTNQSLFKTRIGLTEIVGYLSGRPDTRLSSLTGVEALTFIKVPGSNRSADWPDCEIIFASGSLASDHGTALRIGANIKNEIYDQLYRPIFKAQQDHYTVLVMPFHPTSVGRVWLQSKDPLKFPMIDANYFEDPVDVEVMLEGIKAAIRIAESPAMQKIGTRLLNTPVPGCESYTFASDDYWRCSIRTMTYTLHHQVATCRMGPASDPTAVVSPELKVHGIRKLRVVDGGIIPFPPTAHTNAPIFMIGEKAADMIKETWSI